MINLFIYLFRKILIFLNILNFTKYTELSSWEDNEESMKITMNVEDDTNDTDADNDNGHYTHNYDDDNDSIYHSLTSGVIR